MVFTADPGIRITGGTIPAAGISPSGQIYLYYSGVPGSPGSFVATSADGVSFGAGRTATLDDQTANPWRTQLPDGTWKIYTLGPTTNTMRSSSSTDGVRFTNDAGFRYTAPESTVGVQTNYTEGNEIVLLYIGDLLGLNNVRRAVSRDGGNTFTFDRANVLGDAGLGGGGRSYVDQRSLKLPDGRRRLITMRAFELFSFITSDGNNYTLESGTRLTTASFSGVSLQTLNDPSLIRLPDGRYRLYVAGNMNGTWVIVSATTSR